MRALLYSIWGTERQQRMESWALLPEANRDDRLYWESCDVQVVEAALESFIEGLRKRAEAYRF